MFILTGLSNENLNQPIRILQVGTRARAVTRHGRQLHANTFPINWKVTYSTAKKNIWNPLSLNHIIAKTHCNCLDIGKIKNNKTELKTSQTKLVDLFYTNFGVGYKHTSTRSRKSVLKYIPYDLNITKYVINSMFELSIHVFNNNCIFENRNWKE